MRSRGGGGRGGRGLGGGNGEVGASCTSFEGSGHPVGVEHVCLTHLARSSRLPGVLGSSRGTRGPVMTVHRTPTLKETYCPLGRADG